jgi:hypothetical protein
MTLEQFLADDRTRELMTRIVNGEPPKSAVAGLAGNVLAAELAKLMGVPPPPMTQASKQTVTVKATPDVVDAEFKEV